MNGVHLLGNKPEEVRDILQIEKDFIQALEMRNAFIASCSPQELYERQGELRREENTMIIKIMIDLVKHLADEKRKADKRIKLI
jgi:hypothetical protein